MEKESLPSAGRHWVQLGEQHALIMQIVAATSTLLFKVFFRAWRGSGGRWRTLAAQNELLVFPVARP